jgi:tetraacyldisaccharide 4'-kinase
MFESLPTLNLLIKFSLWQDYDRDPEILKQLNPFKTFVLCSTLKILPYRGNNEEIFKKFLKDQLKLEFSAAD